MPTKPRKQPRPPTGLLMLDLFSGLGGASKPFRDRGWDVVTIDIDPRFSPDLLADVSKLSVQDVFRATGGRPVDFFWASPPCVEFARESMPWCRTGKTPSMDLVLATIALAQSVKPRWFALENVRGAVAHVTPILGHPTYTSGGIRLWGFLPSGPLPKVITRKEHFSSKRRAERALIPYELGWALAQNAEREAHST